MNNLSICLIGGKWTYNKKEECPIFTKWVESILEQLAELDVLLVQYFNGGIIWKLEQILTLNQYDIVYLDVSEIEDCKAYHELINQLNKLHFLNKVCFITTNEFFDLKIKQLNNEKISSLSITQDNFITVIKNILNES